MKKCNRCGKELNDSSNFCTACGSPDLFVIEINNESAINAQNKQFDPNSGDDGASNIVPNLNTPSVITYTPPVNGQVAEKDGANYETLNNGIKLGNGNIIAGIVGAFLFSLIGAVLYFLVYQIGFIAGICGLVIFVLASFGYDLFAKSDKNTTIGIIVSIVMTVIIIFISLYLSLSFEIFKILKEDGYTLIDAIKVTPKALTDAEIRDAYIEDLIFAYIFSFVAVIGNIVTRIKQKRINNANIS